MDPSREHRSQRTSSEAVAGILLGDPEGWTNQGFREAKEVRWRGAAKRGRETSSPASTKNLMKKLPIGECTPVNTLHAAVLYVDLIWAPTSRSPLDLERCQLSDAAAGWRQQRG